jgi:dTDP-3-amino-2,3,6-trideoxy-4-keto-D-glucose/dTDP-3-amino-3,4,6-trideoxy-alpha-D-glucose/dTDP-2,6-dideoxy-D-kanosamine transaminase
MPCQIARMIKACRLYPFDKGVWAWHLGHQRLFSDLPPDVANRPSRTRSAAHSPHQVTCHLFAQCAKPARRSTEHIWQHMVAHTLQKALPITMQVPSFRFPQDRVESEALQAMMAAAASGRIILGPQTSAFESEFADYCGSPHAIGVANGSDALELALRALSVGSGDAVALVANAGFYGSIAVRILQAEPVYVDVDPHSLLMSPERLRQAFESATRPIKCVIVTHLYGQMADIDNLMAIARQYGAVVIEDCAQAHGAKHNDRRAGSFGDVGCFSFYPTKNLGAVGDGGMVVTASDDYAARLRSLRTYGWSAKYSVDLPGGRNSRLDEIQAAALRIRLRSLDERNSERRRMAARYHAAFAHTPLLLPISIGDDYVGHLYVVRHPQRDLLKSELAQRQVASDIHYPIADHMQRAYQTSCTLPNTEQACHQVLSLPCFPGLSAAEQDHVIESVLAALSTCTP